MMKEGKGLPSSKVAVNVKVWLSTSVGGGNGICTIGSEEVLVITYGKGITAPENTGGVFA
jgi:hypothetical protein